MENQENKISRTEKYDNTYEREVDAVWVAIIINVFAVLAARFYGPLNSTIVGLLNFGYRILASMWVYRISERQNRKSDLNAFLAFILPTLMLIIAGCSRKKNALYFPNAMIEESETAGKEEDIEYVQTENKEEDIEEIPTTLQIEETKKNTKTTNMRSVINKISLLLVLLVGFMHFLILVNKPKRAVFDADYKMYPFGNENPGDFYIIPLYMLNAFYCIYFLYILLLLFKVLRLEIDFSGIGKKSFVLIGALLFLNLSASPQIKSFNKLLSLHSMQYDAFKGVMKYESYKYDNVCYPAPGIEGKMWFYNDSMAIAYCPYKNSNIIICIDQDIDFLEEILINLKSNGFSKITDNKDVRCYQKGNTYFIIQVSNTKIVKNAMTYMILDDLESLRSVVETQK